MRKKRIRENNGGVEAGGGGEGTPAIKTPIGSFFLCLVNRTIGRVCEVMRYKNNGNVGYRELWLI